MPSPSRTTAQPETRPTAAGPTGTCPRLWPSAPAAFAGGVAAGYIAYLHRSPALYKHLAGTSAWPQQLVVAALVGAVFGYAYWRHHRTPGRPGEPPWLMIPGQAGGDGGEHDVGQRDDRQASPAPRAISPGTVLGTFTDASGPPREGRCAVTIPDRAL